MSPDVVIATTTSAAGPQENGKATDGSWQKKKEKAPNFVTNFMDLLNTCSWHSSQAAQTAGTLSFAR